MSASRMRLHRERLAQGRMIVPVDVSEADVEWLVEHHLLDAMHADDRDMIGGAIARMVRLLRVTTSVPETS